MTRTFARTLCLPVLLALAATPALAGKADRAREAIAQAQGKVDAAAHLGASGDVPQLQAQAAAALRTAREELDRGHKAEAFDAANHASMLADNAIGQAQHNRAAAQAAERDNAQATAAAAQADAAQANARADQAAQTAAAAQADAAAARSQPPVVMQVATPAPAPAPTTTTVTTETTKTAAATGTTAVHHPVVRKKVASRPYRRAVNTEKTTTTVTTQPN